jgi:uncharacterized protein with von Willebrand factor type A (vWA) domain
VTFLNRAAGGARGRVSQAPPRAPRGSEHAPVDELVLDDFRKDAPMFNAFLERPFQIDGKDFEASPDAKRDLFLTNFTSRAPGVLDEAAVKPSRKLTREVIAQLQHNEHHLATLAHTRTDRTVSALVAMREAEELERAMQEHEAAEEAEKANDAQQAEQEIEDLQSQLEQLREQAKTLSDQGFPIPAHVTDEVKDVTAQREAKVAELAQIDAGQGQTMPGTAVAIAERTASQGEKIADVWMSLPGNEPGKRSRTNPDAAIRLANLWMQSAEMQERALLIGRMNRNFRAAVAKSTKGGNDEIAGVGRGDDLPNVLMSERMQLGHPLLRNMFLRGFVDQTLLQYEMVGTEHVQQGPGIFCVDLSGSMLDGHRFRFAIAAATAFVRMMHRDHRDAIVLLYTTRVVGEYEFPHRRPIDLEVLTDLASQAADRMAGTDITHVMDRAADIVENVPEFKRADVVLLTDGADSWGSDDPPVRERLKAKGVRIHGVLVHGAATTNYTAQMCDHEISVAELSAPSEATTQLAQAVMST